jgi:hypothetical protein
MWAHYHEHGADFDAGVDAAPIDNNRLRQEAEVMGILDPEGVARHLGMDGGDVLSDFIGDRQDEDLLDEILERLGECAGQGSFDQYQTEGHDYVTDLAYMLIDSVFHMPSLAPICSLLALTEWQHRCY